MSTDSVLAACAAGGVRLFVPDDSIEAAGGDLGLSPAMTVEEFFDGYVLPVVGKACHWSRGTIKATREAVNYWTALSGNPALAAISAFHCAAFSGGLRVQETRDSEFLATATVIKHCHALQKVLNIAGPRDQRSKKDLRRFGAGLIAAPPWIEAPEPDDEFPDGDFELDEVHAILAACPRMKVPLYAPNPAAWWTALVTFICATGLRIGTTMMLEWEHIDDQMLLIPGVIAKRKRKHVQYLHPEAYAKIVPLKGRSKRVFSVDLWPAPGTQRWVHACRRQLLELAGLAAERRFGFHGFRKFHATELYGIDELAARDSLNHKDIETTRRSYAAKKRQLAAHVARQKAAIDQLPLFRATAGGAAPHV